MAEKKYSHKQMKKLMKEDEVASVVDKVLSWGKENKTLVYGIVIAIFAAIAIYVAVTSYSTNKTEKSELAFSKATEIFYYKPKKNEAPKYKNKEEQYNKALEEFKKLEKENLTKSVKLRAKFYEALCYLNLNNIGEAEKILENLYNSAPYPFKTTVALTLVNVKSNSGELDKAIAILDNLMKQDTFKNPVKDYELLKKSKILVKQGKLEEAKELLNQLILDFPDSAFATDAKKEKENIS
ncbi:hypothetical protein TTHT_0823 [Thermotomaculum hydrothermale]|uniref:Ancillary SecYEG translocon subunit/Cell division coordinator CpoB TPR domain-containing protein n=1 Tax=Thermotomaculum hydrothermale TaxID=981385 RepID=A0A7R6SZ50_9BACT|nr:tetratricopeptide repeat protein [Thermotomaculum hydrothermale]BBB32387.1 hypothetical protein TTHT_0823 [Thermotomaculum hydrothermale]